MRTKFRLKPGYKGWYFYLQFQDEIKIFNWRFKVWKYIPDSDYLMRFRRKSCPIIIGWCSSHSYLIFFSREQAEKWIKNNDLDDHLRGLKDKNIERTTIKYF